MDWITPILTIIGASGGAAISTLIGIKYRLRGVEKDIKNMKDTDEEICNQLKDIEHRQIQITTFLKLEFDKSRGILD